MAAGAALAVPLIGAPVPTCAGLLLLATVWALLRRRRSATASDPAERADDLVARLRPDPAGPVRREIAGSTNRHAA